MIRVSSLHPNVQRSIYKGLSKGNTAEKFLTERGLSMPKSPINRFNSSSTQAPKSSSPDSLVKGSGTTLPNTDASRISASSISQASAN